MKKAIALALLLLLPWESAALARDRILIVGSATVAPFAVAVGGEFARIRGFPAPQVDSTGTVAGFGLFCAGADTTTPDIAVAARRIRAAEIAGCATHGVSAIAEIVIGHGGIVVATAKGGSPLALSRSQLYLALARTVPFGGKLIPNPYRRWSDIDPKLPRTDIRIFGPAANHGTHDALMELVNDPACEKFTEIQELPDARRAATCETLRDDGAFVAVTGGYDIIRRALIEHPRAVGILNFSEFERHGSEIGAAAIDGQPPSFETIDRHTYPLSRSLYLYVKKSHVGIIPGLALYLREFASELAWGRDGYLAALGLVALSDPDREAEAAKARALPGLQP